MLRAPTISRSARSCAFPEGGPWSRWPFSAAAPAGISRPASRWRRSCGAAPRAAVPHRGPQVEHALLDRARAAARAVRRPRAAFAAGLRELGRRHEALASRGAPGRPGRDRGAGRLGRAARRADRLLRPAVGAHRAEPARGARAAAAGRARRARLPRRPGRGHAARPQEHAGHRQPGARPAARPARRGLHAPRARSGAARCCSWAAARARATSTPCSSLSAVLAETGAPWQVLNITGNQPATLVGHGRARGAPALRGGHGLGLQRHRRRRVPRRRQHGLGAGRHGHALHPRALPAPRRPSPGGQRPRAGGGGRRLHDRARRSDRPARRAALLSLALRGCRR